MMQDDDDDDDDDNNDPMILNNRAKNHTSERTIVPWTVIFFIANACAVSHYISYSGIVTVLSTVPNTLVRVCTEFFFRVSRFWITCLQSSRGSIILKVSTTSTGVLETLGHISFRTGYWEVRWRQNFPIGGPLNFFCKASPKNAKKQLFLLLGNYSRFWDWHTNQGITM